MGDEVHAEDGLLDPAAEVTLGNCDREPIHIPGAIQPHGVLLTLSEPDLQIVQASENVSRFLGRSAGQLIGGEIGQVLSEQSVAALRELVGRGDEQEIGSTPVEVLAISAPVACELLVHRSGGLLVCELEPRLSLQSGEDEISGVPNASSLTGGVQELFHRAASEVRQLTGYDRVMVYRFDPDGHGEVIGEARDGRLDPLLGHHYPATDIPRQARRLYLRQMIRMIVDVDYEPARIVPGNNPLNGQPLDLGLATLRSVSPIHLEYLRNMDVTATLTISLIRDGELWGMIACHHYSPHFVPYRLRTACRFIGELLSVQLAHTEAVDLERERETLRKVRDHVLDEVRASQTLSAGLGTAAESLVELCLADGVAVLTHDQRITAGYVPEPGPEADLLQHVPARRPLVIDRLSRELPAISHHTELSGVLALALPAEIGTYIVWYRDDWARDLKWGGRPQRVAASGSDVDGPQVTVTTPLVRNVATDGHRPIATVDRPADRGRH